MPRRDLRAIFRTTSSPQTGFGHLRRCLTLARELSDRGWRCRFWVTGDERGRDFVRTQGFEAADERALDAGPDVLLVDDYSVPSEEFARWRPAVRCLAVVDDLADRDLGCDLVVNASANASLLAYRTSPGCTLLLGPRYALLRPAFRRVPPRSTGMARRLLVTLGGSDPLRQTPAVVAEALSHDPALVLDVILGPLHDGGEPEESDRVRVHRAPPEPAALMRGSDLAVSAGGQTTYELAACGVPAIALCVAENQRGSLSALATVPTLLLVEDVGSTGEAIHMLAADRALRERMSRAGQGLVDGCGATRVAEALEAAVSSRAPLEK